MVSVMFRLSISRFFLRAKRQWKLTIPTRSLTNSRTHLVSNSESGITPESNQPTISTALGVAEQLPESRVKSWAERLDTIAGKSRLPRTVQAIYLRPLRRKAKYGLPVCELQLRSYSVRNVEFFADFAIRAAYYLNLPVSGPVPLPRIVERWTVPRSNFVHKKSQENFERITLRRLVQIKDGDSQVVQTWLAFLRKHAFYGVGMKANVWDYESLDVAKSMDEALPEIEGSLEPHLVQFGRRREAKPEDSMHDVLDSARFLHNKGPLTSVRKD